MDTEIGNRVKFNEHVEIKYIHHWKFAHWQARRGPWMLAALDRGRFQNRINNLEKIITPILLKQKNYKLYLCKIFINNNKNI